MAEFTQNNAALDKRTYLDAAKGKPSGRGFLRQSPKTYANYKASLKLDCSAWKAINTTANPNAAFMPPVEIVLTMLMNANIHTEQRNVLGLTYVPKLRSYFVGFATSEVADSALPLPIQMGDSEVHLQRINTRTRTFKIEGVQPVTKDVDIVVAFNGLTGLEVVQGGIKRHRVKAIQPTEGPVWEPFNGRVLVRCEVSEDFVEPEKVTITVEGEESETFDVLPPGLVDLPTVPTTSSAQTNKQTTNKRKQRQRRRTNDMTKSTVPREVDGERTPSTAKPTSEKSTHFNASRSSIIPGSEDNVSRSSIRLPADEVTNVSRSDHEVSPADEATVRRLSPVLPTEVDDNASGPGSPPAGNVNNTPPVEHDSGTSPPPVEHGSRLGTPPPGENSDTSTPMENVEDAPKEESVADEASSPTKLQTDTDSDLDSATTEFSRRSCRSTSESECDDPVPASILPPAYDLFSDTPLKTDWGEVVDTVFTRGDGAPWADMDINDDTVFFSEFAKQAGDSWAKNSEAAASAIPKRIGRIGKRQRVSSSNSSVEDIIPKVPPKSPPKAPQKGLRVSSSISSVEDIIPKVPPKGPPRSTRTFLIGGEILKGLVKQPPFKFFPKKDIRITKYRTEIWTFATEPENFNITIKDYDTILFTLGTQVLRQNLKIASKATENHLDTMCQSSHTKDLRLIYIQPPPPRRQGVDKETQAHAYREYENILAYSDKLAKDGLLETYQFPTSPKGQIWEDLKSDLLKTVIYEQAAQELVELLAP